VTGICSTLLRVGCGAGAWWDDDTPAQGDEQVGGGLVRWRGGLGEGVVWGVTNLGWEDVQSCWGARGERGGGQGGGVEETRTIDSGKACLSREEKGRLERGGGGAGVSAEDTCSSSVVE
jgi:hypothetical protein